MTLYVRIHIHVRQCRKCGKRSFIKKRLCANPACEFWYDRRGALQEAAEKQANLRAVRDAFYWTPPRSVRGPDGAARLPTAAEAALAEACDIGRRLRSGTSARERDDRAAAAERLARCTLV